MPIRRLTASGEYGPEEIKVMVAAYVGAMLELGLVDGNDPRAEIIAKSIIRVAATGERDPEKLKDRAIHALGARKTAA
jgi:hypothetical protein